MKGSSPVHLEVSLDGTILITVDDASPGRLPTGVPGIENHDQGVRYDRFDVFARVSGCLSGRGPRTVRFGPRPSPSR